MPSDVIVETTSGKIRGAEVRGVYAFKGVPYAALKAGGHRFMPPAATAPWSGVRDALHFGARAFQDDEAFPLPHEIRTLMTPAAPEPMSENCLLLNIWTPAVGDPGKRPVMVWLHGGGFIAGSGADPWTHGEGLAAYEDLVVVTLNHRLGVFGYLHLEDLAGPEFAGSSVAGMLDIVAALAWVRDNIAEFGGDPRNVTLFGESGGGAKVSVLMAMPQARGLFHKAIVQSGPALKMASRADATTTAEGFLAELGLDSRNVRELRTMKAEQLLAAQSAVQKKISLASFAERRRRGFNPVSGQEHFPTDPFEPKAPPISKDIPLLIGTNTHEMTIFFGLEPWLPKLDDTALRERLRLFGGDRVDHLVDEYRKVRRSESPDDLFIAITTDQGIRIPSLTMADRKVAQGGADVFVYLFNRETSALSGRLKSTHILEVPYVFRTVADAPFAEKSPADLSLAARMSAAWANFARTGNPGTNGLPPWPAYSTELRPTMIFDEHCRIELDPFGQERQAWDAK